MHAGGTGWNGVDRCQVSIPGFPQPSLAVGTGVNTGEDELSTVSTVSTVSLAALQSDVFGCLRMCSDVFDSLQDLTCRGRLMLFSTKAACQRGTRSDGEHQDKEPGILPPMYQRLGLC